MLYIVFLSVWGINLVYLFGQTKKMGGTAHRIRDKLESIGYED
jgi:hypothetical protein